jgi:hypothetical protein
MPFSMFALSSSYILTSIILILRTDLFIHDISSSRCYQGEVFRYCRGEVFRCYRGEVFRYYRGEVFHYFRPLMGLFSLIGFATIVAKP